MQINFVNEEGSFVPLAEIEKQAIAMALKIFPCRSEAARALDIGRSTLYQKIRKYDLCEEARRARKRREQLKAIEIERRQHEEMGTLLIAA